MNGLELMEKHVSDSKNKILQSSGVTVSADGRYLMLKNSYYGFLVKLPYFNILSASEQSEVKRIFEYAHSSKVVESVRYHYDDGYHIENGYSYVVDNLRYILALPNSDADASFVKFVMIASLGKMTKFLSKRNVILMFADRHNIARVVNEPSCDGVDEKSSELSERFPDLGNKVLSGSVYSLDNLVLGASEKIALSKYHYGNVEELFYLQMTLMRWVAASSMTLHEVIMMQEVYGVELPVLDTKKALSKCGTVYFFLHSFILAIHEHYDESFNALKFLFDKKISDGILFTTADEYEAYSLFFKLRLPFFENYQNDEAICSLLKFKEDFPVEFFGYDNFVNLMVNHVDPNGYLSKTFKKSKSSIPRVYYFLFCLLKFDEDKTLGLIEFLEGNSLNLLNLNKQERYDFLDMVKEYAETNNNIPWGLLFNMYSFDFLDVSRGTTKII